MRIILLYVWLMVLGMLSCTNYDVNPVDSQAYHGVPLVIFDTDISWTVIHPIKQVYLTCECDTGQKMWDPLAVINAIEGDALFTFSGRGTVAITDAAETIFTPSASGNCRYQFAGDTTWNATMLEKIRNVNKAH